MTEAAQRGPDARVRRYSTRACGARAWAGLNAFVVAPARRAPRRRSLRRVGGSRATAGRDRVTASSDGGRRDEAADLAHRRLRPALPTWRQGRVRTVSSSTFYALGVAGCRGTRSARTRLGPRPRAPGSRPTRGSPSPRLRPRGKGTSAIVVAAACSSRPGPMRSPLRGCRPLEGRGARRGRNRAVAREQEGEEQYPRRAGGEARRRRRVGRPADGDRLEARLRGTAAARRASASTCSRAAR